MEKVYRVENPFTLVGLWFNHKGERTDFIATVDGAQSQHLPMPDDEDLAGGWFSATDNLADLADWFSKDDTYRLADAGYRLYEFLAEDVRRVPGHVVFRKETAMRRQLPWSMIPFAGAPLRLPERVGAFA